MFDQSAFTFTLAQVNATQSASPSTILYWIVGVLVCAGTVMFALAISMMRRRSFAPPVHDVPGARHAVEAAPASASPTLRTPQSSTALPMNPTTQEAQNLLRLMGEAEELCTRLGRDLDAKAERLERLLARAEGRLGPTGAPPPEPMRGVMPTVEISRPQPTPMVHAAPPPQPLPTQPSLTQASPAPRPEIVTRPVGVPALAGSPAVHAPSSSPARSAPDPFGLDPLTQEIYRLSDAGVGASLIAQQLGQHAGKVELILALRAR